MNLKLFTSKKIAEKNKAPNELLCNYNITNYFIANDYSHFLDVIKESKSKHYYEYIRCKNYCPFYFDIDIKSTEPEFQTADDTVIQIKELLYTLYPDFDIQLVVLESHGSIKKSFHIIARFSKDQIDYYVKDSSVLKALVTDRFSDIKFIDTSVYRDGLFRTIYSTKQGQDRYFSKSHLSDPFNDLDTFVGYRRSETFSILPEIDIITTPTDTSLAIVPINTDSGIPPVQSELTSNDHKVIYKFIKTVYNYSKDQVVEIILNNNLNCIIIGLSDTFCRNIDDGREHASNHQYIVIGVHQTCIKCHDPDCTSYRYNVVKRCDYPASLQKILKNVLEINQDELELIEQTIKECKEYINSNYNDTATNVVFDQSEMIFRGDVNNTSLAAVVNGKCRICQLQHEITNAGYCLKCTVCKSVFPKNQIIPVDEKYKNLNSFFLNYNQLVNTGTVNIINNYYGEDEFNCDFEIDNSIFKSKSMTKLYNQVLDGHKIIKISELISKIEVNFRYTGEWYYFNDSIWKMDKESLELKRRMLSLTNNFNKIKNFYESKTEERYTDIIKNIKSLVNKIYKPGFEEEVIKGAKIYYSDEDFIKKLNSKKHLLPFTNGVYDLLTGEFRSTTKEDYINLTTGFDYDPNVCNNEVVTFIQQVIPNENVRNYVLKKMSECLNGDIPNTHFLFFIGESGANGKSQILNLMKLVMGEFGEKVEVTLITRKRNNANEANTEKIKLMNKRFAFLSEPEDGEKINIGLLKELTGSEEIVARGLYESAQCFVMEAKLFLACNELPEIKGEDQALWRRIRAVDFPSRFVDEPEKPNEYMIDRTLPSRMREDVSWRQTFMNILLEYYYKTGITEPEEVKVRTNEYKHTNNTLELWLDENIEYKEDNILHAKDFFTLYSPKQLQPAKKTKMIKEIDTWITMRFPNIESQYRNSQYNHTRYRGWVHFGFKEDT